MLEIVRKWPVDGVIQGCMDTGKQLIVHQVVEPGHVLLPMLLPELGPVHLTIMPDFPSAFCTMASSACVTASLTMVVLISIRKSAVETVSRATDHHFRNSLPVLYL